MSRCGGMALMRLGFRAPVDGGAMRVAELLEQIANQGGTVEGPYAPPMTAREFAIRYSGTGRYLVVVCGHVMVAAPGALYNQNGHGNEPIIAVYKVIKAQ